MKSSLKLRFQNRNSTDSSSSTGHSTPGTSLSRIASSHDNRARTLILARDVTIENTRFRHQEMGAIKIETGYTFNVWAEGYGATTSSSETAPSNPSIQRTQATTARQGTFSWGVYMKSDPSAERTEYPILANILFENNTFQGNLRTRCLHLLRRKRDLQKQHLHQQQARNKNLPYRGSFYVTHANNVNVVNNTMSNRLTSTTQESKSSLTPSKMSSSKATKQLTRMTGYAMTDKNLILCDLDGTLTHEVNHSPNQPSRRWRRRAETDTSSPSPREGHPTRHGISLRGNAAGLPDLLDGRRHHGLENTSNDRALVAGQKQVRKSSRR